ncbi:MAG: putative amidohydrolase YtcJ [Flavobacteriales bacterium]|jgi:predicted amidohydrolase YtcJ
MFPLNPLFLIRALITLTFLLMCTSSKAQFASVVYENGIIYTSNENQGFVESIAILDGVFLSVGTNEETAQFIGSDTEVIDLEGKVVLPGLHDVHIHLLEASAAGEGTCTLNAFEPDLWQLGQDLEECNPQANSNGWIFAWGHSIFTLLESSETPKAVLDFYFPDIPVVCMEETSHSAWVNSAALAALSIDGGTPDPEGGHIVKFGGEATGLLLDSAGDLAFDMALSVNDEVEMANYNGLVDFGLPAIAALGITSICEGRTYWKRNYIETWEAVKNNGALTARVTLAPWAYPSDEDEEQLEMLASLYNEGDELLKVDQIKLYIDGITLGGTAALDQPYVYNFGWPFNQGLNYFTQERLQNYIEILELIGYDFFIHSIGNRGTFEVLNAIEEARETNGDVGARHRVTHVEIVNASDIPRFEELNVGADGQVTAYWSQPNQWSENSFLVGDELAEDMIPLKSLEDAGANITLSSDWDVSSMNPFRSIQNAVTRIPQNMASVENAVDAKTINSAYALSQEEYTGSIEAGKLADFICIDRNIFEIPENQIAQTQVTLTVLGGVVVYENDNAPTNLEEVTKGVLIFPTVTATSIQIKLNGMSQVKARLVSANGQLIRDGFSVSDGDVIDCSSLAEGIYIIQLTDFGMESKFVVSR